MIKFGSATADYFRQKIQRPFFAFYLKDRGPMPLAEATVFEGGSNRWRSFDAWPPKDATRKALYLHADGVLSFDQPAAGPAFTATSPTRPSQCPTAAARSSRPITPRDPTGVPGRSRTNASSTTGPMC